MINAGFPTTASFGHTLINGVVTGLLKSTLLSRPGVRLISRATLVTGITYGVGIGAGIGGPLELSGVTPVTYSVHVLLGALVCV